MRISWLVAMVLAAPTTVFAQSLDEALSHYQQGEAEEARASFEGLLRLGQSGPGQLARIYRHLGVLYAAFGEDERALEAFSWSLAADPHQGMPSELGPNQRAIFSSAQQGNPGASFALRREDGGQLTVVLQNTPMQTRVELRLGRERAQGTDGVASLQLPDGGWLTNTLIAEMRAFDPYGNTVVFTREPIEREESQPRRRRGLIWGVTLTAVAVVAAALTTTLLVTRSEGNFGEAMVVWP